MPGNFESLPFTVSVKPSELHKYGGNCGANCYLTMPFNKSARIEIENQGDNAYIQYFLHRLRIVRRAAPERLAVLSRTLAAIKCRVWLGARWDSDQLARNSVDQSRWQGQLCHPRDRGPRQLYRLQSFRHALSGGERDSADKIDIRHGGAKGTT